MTFRADIQRLNPGAKITLFALDATVCGDDQIRYFANGTNELGEPIVWQGISYNFLPINADGFGTSSKGVIPRPKLQVSALDGAIGILIRTYDDLIGATVYRKRVLAQYLDAANFAPMTASDEPFTPNQLSIDGIDVTADVSVTNMKRMDWQGGARTNYCTKSEDFSGFTIQGGGGTWWGETDGNATQPVVTDADEVGPNGMNAARVQMSLSGSDSTYRCGFMHNVDYITGRPYTVSFWAKTKDGSTKSVWLVTSNTQRQLITITGEWQRFSYSQTEDYTGTSRFGLRLCGATASSTTADIVVTGFQVEYGSTATAYIETDTAPTTVYDVAYKTLSTAPRTNMILQSETLASSPWNLGAITIGTNATKSPRGDTTAESMTKNAAAYQFMSQAFTAEIGKTYVASFFAKAGTLTDCCLGIADAVSSGWDSRVCFGLYTKAMSTRYALGFAGRGVEDLGDGWLRVWVAATATTTTGRVLLYPGDMSQAVAGSIYGWGVQVEEGSVPTPYMGPTLASPATITDFAASIVGVVTLGEAASGVYTWSGTGKGNATADPDGGYDDDVYEINQKTYEGPDFIEFELTAKNDLEGMEAPRHKLYRDVCRWNDVSICQYSVGGLCAKNLEGCKAHYGEDGYLPFGGHLGVRIL